MQRADSWEKTLMLGKIEGRRRKGATEEEMVWWHHRLNGHEFEQNLGNTEGQGSPVCCNSWAHEDWDTTQSWITMKTTASILWRWLVNVLGVWFGRMWLKYLLSWLNFLLHFTRKKKKIMCVLVPQPTAGDPVPEDWLKLTISLISQHGAWKESIGTPALCCNGCCWQPLIPDFMCFSSCLGGQWRAKGRWRICIYWTNLLLELGQLLATSLWVKLNYWKMFISDPVDPQETLRGDGSIPDFCGALILMMLSLNHGSLKYARKSGSL